MRLAYLDEETVVNIDLIASIVSLHYTVEDTTRVWLTGSTEYVQVNRSISEVVEIIEERASRTTSVTRQGVTYETAV